MLRTHNEPITLNEVMSLQASDCAIRRRMLATIQLNSDAAASGQEGR